MRWRGADFIVIAVVLICALGIWLYPLLSDNGAYAKIEQNGNTQSLSLKEDRVVELENATAQIKNGAISITHANCPDMVCVKTGEISREGQSIVCVPNKIVITIDGKSNVDAISN